MRSAVRQLFAFFVAFTLGAVPVTGGLAALRAGAAATQQTTTNTPAEEETEHASGSVETAFARLGSGHPPAPKPTCRRGPEPTAWLALPPSLPVLEDARRTLVPRRTDPPDSQA